MKVIGLDNKQYIWNPTSNAESKQEVSSYHERARALLKDLFSCERILEEVTLPGTRPLLFADFLIHSRKILIEVHGPQHYHWIPFFHGTKRDFLVGKRNDENKKEWCRLNNFSYIELPHWETDHEWRHRILEFGAKSPSG